jgi:DNA-binding SARP family transcriptional activator
VSTVLLRIVGECIVQIGARRVEPGAPFLFALLLYLGAERGRRIPRKELIEVLFPEERNARAAAHNLRQLLYRLRRFGVPLSLAEHAVALEPIHVRSTVDELLDSAALGRLQALQSSCIVLPHYEPPPSTQLSEWVDGLRDRVHTSIRRQLTLSLEDARRRADWRLLESIARRLLEIDPLSETATLGLAEAIARTGSKAIAVGLLERYERDLGTSGVTLALPAQLLKRRISSSVRSAGDLDTTSLPLLGRNEEMAELATMWARARAGHFLTARVTGEKSIGKTRLVEEFAAMVEMDGSGSIVVVRPTPGDRERPLALFADLSRQLLGLPGAAGCDPHSLPFLRRLSGASTPRGAVVGEHNQAPYEDASVRRAVGDLVGSVSEERPLLCVVDNADHLDDASRALLRVTQEQLPNHRILFLLCTQRWDAGMASLRLHPLPTSDIKELLRVLVLRSGVQLGERESAWCLDTAAGNPGHLELLVRHASHAWAPEAIPADLVALVDQRIAELSAEARYALQAVAIAGDTLTPMGIEAVTGLGPYELLDALNELDRSSLIVRKSDGLRCRSAFVNDRAVRAATTTTLAVMHERAALLLEREHVGQPLSQVGAWRIASHWQQAGNWKRARECLRACWQQAVDIGQPMAAVSAIRAALQQADTVDEKAQLLDDLIGALQAAGEASSLEPAVGERQSLSPAVQDPPARRAELAFDRVEARVPGLDSVCCHISSLREHVRSPLLDAGRRIRAARLLMLAADGNIDDALARETFLINRDLHAAAPRTRLVQRLTALIHHCVFGDRAEAVQLVGEIEDLASRGERSWYTYVGRTACSIARELVGDGPWDHSDVERTYAECMQASMSVSALACASRLTSLLIGDGNIHEARTWMRAAEELRVTLGGASTPADYWTGQIDLALLEGAADRARAALAAMTHGAEDQVTCDRLADRMIVYRMRVALMCDGRRPTQEILARLLQYHERGKRFGRHDDHMQVLWSSLRAVGRSADASRLLRSYLRSERRERRPCCYLLRLTTVDDPEWTRPDDL